MSKFNKGDKVVNTVTGELGFVIEVYPPRRGRQLYKVKYEDRETDEPSEDLEPDVDLSDPFERCKLNLFGYYVEYLKVNTAFKIKSCNNSTISSLKASRTLFRPYQFKPLLKFLNSDDRRLLIADEVGLGKTIEAGHIMLEMKARGELHNALVICPKSLRAKWATELTEKFGLDFIDIENKSDLIHEMQYHNGQIHAVVNYDKFQKNSELYNYVMEKNIRFSIVVCDESHRLRNNGTLIYKGLTDVLTMSGSIVFMSATPIMINEENLYNQLHLLNPELYDNKEVFANNIRLNGPFVAALGNLNKGIPLPKIADELFNSVITTINNIDDNQYLEYHKVIDYFKDFPVFKAIVHDLTEEDDTPALRARLQYNLHEMSPMNLIFSRTRKREITQNWSQAERCPHTRYVDLSDQERGEYDALLEKYKDDHTTEDEYGNVRSGLFGLITVKRQLASCIAAYSGNWSATCFPDDSKFDELLNIIRHVLAAGEKKVIVFAIFKKTICYLSERLLSLGIKNVRIFGGGSIDRNAELEKFRTDGSIQVLISSEVGSEGLDMQFCSTLVNYDLPWNPMVVEQRIGRIDRFGQESPKVNIYNIVVNESILEVIFERLLQRIGIFKNSIGDLEAILDSRMDGTDGTVTIKDAIKNLESDFYSNTLTIQEVERKQHEIEQAIENERLNLQKIEEGLTNTLTDDSYFQNEIQRIINNNAFVTDSELKHFVEQLLKEKLTTCNMEPTDRPDVFRFSMSKSDQNALKNFVRQNEPADIDCHRLFAGFIGKIEDKTSFLLTFDQELAFKEKSLEFVNIYHPIIRAGVRWFEGESDKKHTTFFFELKSDKLPDELERGQYMLAIYKVGVSRNVYGDRNMRTDSLYPILFDLKRQVIIEDGQLAERFMGCAQVDGRYAPLDQAYKLDSDMIDDLRYDLNGAIGRHVKSKLNEMKERIENSCRLRIQQTMQYYESRISNISKGIEKQQSEYETAMILQDNGRIRETEGALRLLRYNLKDLQNRKEQELAKIGKDVQLKVSQEIMSLNLINVV